MCALAILERNIMVVPFYFLPYFSCVHMSSDCCCAKCDSAVRSNVQAVAFPICEERDFGVDCRIDFFANSSMEAWICG
jgi:hypothetical protein